MNEDDSEINKIIISHIQFKKGKTGLSELKEILPLEEEEKII